MVDRIFAPDLLKALDRFIADQHPDMSRYNALKLAFSDWAAAHGYLDIVRDETEVFPAGRRIAVSRTDRTTAGGMLDRLMADKSPRACQPPE